MCGFCVAQMSVHQIRGSKKKGKGVSEGNSVIHMMCIDVRMLCTVANIGKTLYVVRLKTVPWCFLISITYMNLTNN